MAIKVGMVSLGCAKNQVDGEMLIDGNETISEALPMLENVPAMLFTHSHGDHYSPEDIERVRKEGVDREIFTLCKNEKYGQLIENLENVEDSASQMADFALAGQTVAQQITTLAGLKAEDADAALQQILCEERMATMYIQPDGTDVLPEDDGEEEEA